MAKGSTEEWRRRESDKQIADITSAIDDINKDNKHIRDKYIPVLDKLAALEPVLDQINPPIVQEFIEKGKVLFNAMILLANMITGFTKIVGKLVKWILPVVVAGAALTIFVKEFFTPGVTLSEALAKLLKVFP